MVLKFLQLSLHRASFKTIGLSFTIANLEPSFCSQLLTNDDDFLKVKEDFAQM